MDAGQMFARLILGSVLVVNVVEEMTLYAAQQAAAPNREAKAKRPSREEIAKVGEKIKAAVEAGEITEEQGWARWEAYLESVGADKGKWPTRTKMAAVRQKIAEAIKAGKMTEAEGRAKWEAYMNSIGADQPRRPGEAQMKVLDRWLGTWKADVVMMPSKWVPEGKEQTESKTVEWILDGRFQQMAARGDGHRSLALQRYDAGSKTYQRWTFDTYGNHSYWTGRWDEQAETMTWKFDFGVIKGTMVDAFVEADQCVTTVEVQDAQGSVLLDIEVGQTREKEQAK